MSDPPILIVGAGIAGLTLAQGLRLRSIPFRLFERHPRSHCSQGHRFRISKHGQTALDSVLTPSLKTLLRDTAAAQHRFEPRYVDNRSLDFAKPAPVDPETMPGMPVDRTWIRMLMMLDIEDAIEYEKEFSSYDVANGHVQVQFADGSTARGRLLVGADGIKSRVRKQLQPDRRLLDLERWVMWGRTPLTESLKKNVPVDMLTWCMYLDREANVQAVVEPMSWEKSVRTSKTTCTGPFKRRFLEQVTQTWHPSLKFLFGSAAHDLLACVPVSSSKPDIEIRAAGQTGHVTLIGDAAHAMSPMGSSGGDTAIRNSADLAHTIGEEGVTISSIATFEARMEERAKERIEHSFDGGKKFWRGKEWTEYHKSNI